MCVIGFASICQTNSKIGLFSSRKAHVSPDPLSMLRSSSDFVAGVRGKRGKKVLILDGNMERGK